MNIAQMRVSIWPEYDDPRVLVLYHGKLAAGTTLPQTVEFRIPSNAEVNATAYSAPDGRLISNPYQTRAEGNWQVVSYPISTDEFQVEFYAPLVQGEPAARQVTFQFSTIYPVDSLTAEVQQPLRSTNFQVAPAPLRTTTDARGFTIAEYDFGSVKADATFDFKATYGKPDATPSVPRATLPAPSTGISVSVPSEAAPGNGGSNTLPLLLAAGLALGGLALIGAAVAARRRGTAPMPASTARPGGGRASASGGFCTECGARLEPGARFCSQCGTPVRAQSRGERR